MKILLLITVILMSGCASKYVMTNCKSVDQNYFVCEKP